MTDTQIAARETPTDRRARNMAVLVWHAGSFVIVNVVLWLLDATLGQSGIQWAFWVTACWGFALAFHSLAASSVDSLQLEEWRARQFFVDGPHDEPDY